MPKQSGLPEETSPQTGHYVTGINAAPTGIRFKLLNLIALFFNNIPSAATGFSSLLGTYTNGGGAGGTFFYINLCGIKLLWGITNSITAGSGGSAAQGINFPAAFFSTVQMIIPGISSQTVYGAQTVSVDSYDVNTAFVKVGSPSGGTAKVSLFVIGT